MCVQVSFFAVVLTVVIVGKAVVKGVERRKRRRRRRLVVVGVGCIFGGWGEFVLYWRRVVVFPGVELGVFDEPSCKVDGGE